MKRITEIAHSLICDDLCHTAIDFTCGNGYDTLYLAKCFECVHAFDIQEEAIKNAEKRCEDYGNISFHLDSHAKAKEYVSSFDFGIFNLGYLPSGDTSITTNANEVIEALDKMLPLLSINGRIVLVLYPGFEQGKKEAELVEEYVNHLHSKQYDCLKIQPCNKVASPYILVIEKH